MSLIAKLRQQYHQDVCQTAVFLKKSTIPSIASLALGTGDIDCVYHFALDELLQAAKTVNNESVSEMLAIMVDGNRLRDIADLPFDLIA